MNIRMSTKGKRPLRSLTPSDKVHAIQRIHDGESKASVARDIGVPESTLRGWCKNEDKLRFMSRQAAAEKMGGEPLADKLDGNTNLLGGPPEKRQRMDNSMPLNFSNKMKFDELTTFKRAPLTGLDFGGNKSLSDIGTFNGLAPDYGAFNGTAKNKVFGADIPRPVDPSIAAISPLSSLSHLSGLTGLSQSPLAISFNELTSNLNLLAQLNPGLAAMSGLNGLANTGNNLRANTMKPKPQIQSPRSETTERQTGLTVKNWAKQKPSTPTSSDSPSFGINLSQSDNTKGQLKSPGTSLMPPQLGGNLPPLPTMPEDPLLYWLKSQQAMLGLNNIYPPPPPIGATSPPIRSSTPQQQSLHASTPPIIPTPLTPSSTPSGSLDDKNSAWFNWCKAFGASLNSLAPAAAAVALHGNPLHQPPTSVNVESSNTVDGPLVGKTGFENILYSQLTKDSAPSPSVQSSSSVEQIHTEAPNNIDMSNKPEDLSARSAKARSSPLSPLPTPAQSPERNVDQTVSNHNSPAPSPIPVGCEADFQQSEAKPDTRNSVADCRDVLDNLLYKINNNNIENSNRQVSSAVSESDASYSSDHNNTDDCPQNNNNNSNKTDEEERAKCAALYEDAEVDADYIEAITHGEKFLQWLENCSNPRVTAVQLMQLRFLISSVKTVLDPKPTIKESTSTSNLSIAIEIDDSSEESNRSKMRRRK
ncbi:protein distal antenna [Lucilia sericata]|uniref:protein distal antenna n=1 Tax=Lucilia sericata TaxID=13632 RepID=UPI0018A85C38|nr:protein distal antenna [Lucilia sericata]